MRLVGQGELDISLQIADYEQCLEESVTAPLNQLIEVSTSTRLVRGHCYCLSLMTINGVA